MSKRRKKGGLKLFRRDPKGPYYIRGTYQGEKVYRSTGTKDWEVAEQALVAEMNRLRNRETRKFPTFRELAEKHLKETVKKSVEDDRRNIERLLPYIGDLPMDQVYRGYDGKGKPWPLERFILDRANKGSLNAKDGFEPLSLRAINGELKIINSIGSQAAKRWRDHYGKPLIPYFTPVPVLTKAEAKALGFRLESQHPPITWDDQVILFNEMDDRVRDLCLFATNTGLRQGEICRLRWDQESFDEQSGIRFFLFRYDEYKNEQNRIVVLNSVAERIVNKQRGVHPRFVFTYKGEPFEKINTSSFRKARARAGLKSPGIEKTTVHSFRVTFSSRLRAAMVPEEDRKDLMGHKSGRSMTSYYSLPDLLKMKEHLERIAEPGARMVPLRRQA